MSVFGYLKSSILSKIVMAVTGAILVSYILVHTLGNLFIYLGPDAINSWSQFLHSLGAGLWIVRIGLIVAAILHIWTSISLKLDNMDAKPDKYAVKKYIKAKLTTRTMLWTGIAIFLFVLYHLAHLTMGMTYPGHFGQEHNFAVAANSLAVHVERTDVFKMIVLSFRNPLISLIYIVAVIIVAFHLNHAVQSMFQTLGWNHPNYFPKIQKASVAFSYFIGICLVSIPLSVLFGIVGGNI
jgi:succinate dehydrogenase / fumarate reductase cytochrome b subunit